MAKQFDIFDGLVFAHTVGAASGDDEELLGFEDESDFFNAGAGNDTIQGLGGNDGVVADVGDDEVTTEGGADTILGGDGSDIIESGDGNDIVFGELAGETGIETGDDSINGEGGDDILLGELGADTLIGGFGSDFLAGGEGDDIVDSHTGKIGNSKSALVERDRINAGEGADEINLFSNYTGGVQATRPKPEGSKNLRLDNSLAIIEDFNIDEDTLNLRDDPDLYDIRQGRFEGRAKADAFILRDDNVVAVLVDVSRTEARNLAIGQVV